MFFVFYFIVDSLILIILMYSLIRKSLFLSSALEKGCFWCYVQRIPKSFEIKRVSIYCNCISLIIIWYFCISNNFKILCVEYHLIKKFELLAKMGLEHVSMMKKFIWTCLALQVSIEKMKIDSRSPYKLSNL